MNIKVITTILLTTICLTSTAQKLANKEQSASASVAFGANQFTSTFSYRYLWNFGKKKQWQIGTGLRLTNNFGKNNYYITAPAKLTSGKTGPAVFFADQINQNIDSVLFGNTQANALNLTINFGYKITDKWSVGFDIDAIGFSFGARQQAAYLANGGLVSATNAKPTGFNLLLVSDNDLGTLNSEFSAKYAINNKWSAKLGFQFLFTEYTTDTNVQTTPTGEKNDRFRNKASQISIGTTYNF